MRYPEALGEDGGRDLLVLGHLGDELVVGGLVEQHRVCSPSPFASPCSTSAHMYTHKKAPVRRKAGDESRIERGKGHGVGSDLLLLLSAAGLGGLGGRRRGLLLLRGLRDRKSVV